MLGVDRLDMIKGIPQKLLAFEKFLDENAAYRQSVVLIQIAVPSRLDVPEYQHLRSQVHEIVGRINGGLFHCRLAYLCQTAVRSITPTQHSFATVCARLCELQC